MIDRLKSLSLSQYISLTLGVGFMIFLAIILFGGTIAAGFTWLITTGDREEDRVSATILAFFFGVVIQIVLMWYFSLGGA